VSEDEPRGECEPVVARLWEELFNLARVGRLDNFFRLGGDSRLALRMIVRLTAQCGVRMHVTAVFQYPTVMELARLIEDERSESAEIGTL
jgi:dihydroaeruginoic acid synthetase